MWWLCSRLCWPFAIHSWVVGEFFFFPGVYAHRLGRLGRESTSFCIRSECKSRFPSSELLIWLHKRPPHWDYLVICSPNFYEVAFPHVSCVLFVCLFVGFFSMLCVVMIRAGCAVPCEDFLKLIWMRFFLSVMKWLKSKQNSLYPS